jgi:beta-glucosidase
MKRALLFPMVILTACVDRPDFDLTSPSLDTLGKTLPTGFLFGTATAAHQVEGGNVDDWTDFELGSFPDGRPHIANRDQSGLADDSWNRFDEDLALMQALGVTAYRFSVEWSRLEPEEGVWNAQAMARYREWALKLRAAGIEPMVTLHHFSLPRWEAAKGGLERPEIADDLAAYARRVGSELGDVVDFWCPINEINVVAAEGWLVGAFPPGKTDDTATQAKVMANLLHAHAKMAKALREVDQVDANGDGHATLITTAHHVRIFQPATHSALDTAIAALTDDFVNEAIPRAFATGHIALTVPGTIDLQEDVPDLKGSIDVLGLNYYSRDIVRADLGSASLSTLTYRPGRPTSDQGWDIYPDGLYILLKRYGAYGWPIVITENGLSDHEGTKRSLFLEQHLAALERAVGEGVDVRGYFHWSLLDNFEWADGFTPRFGLYQVDYANGRTRRPSPAVATFKRISQNLR